MKYNNDIFIEKAKHKHGDVYDYSLTKYISSKECVFIVCREHDVFKMLPAKHLNGRGCPICGRNTSHEQKRKSSKNVIISFKNKHGDIYDYSEVIYFNSKTKVNIICKKHGIFEQTPDNHLKGKGCPICGNKKKGLSNRIGNVMFKKRANERHLDKYDYSMVDYINVNEKIKIICSIHGLFEQTPHNHLNGKGCPICCESKGEQKIGQVLDFLKVKYLKQKKFKNCINQKPLLFDFYIPNNNVLIEYDGIQHYKPVKLFGGVEQYKLQSVIDNIKNQYAINNKIKLIRIPYFNYDSIEEILVKEIGAQE